MKTFLALLAVFSMLFTQPAFAGPHYARYIEVFLHTTTVSDQAYTTIFASPDFDVKQISVFSTSQNPVYIATGAAGSETDQFVAPPGTLPGNPGAGYPGAPVGTYTGETKFFPLHSPAGKRISVRCGRSPCATGYMQFGIFY